MRINKESIEEYIDYLSCVHDSIMEEINSSSSRISREIADKVCSLLEDLKNKAEHCIILPTEDDIQHEIADIIKNGYFESIEGIENFIRNQNEVLDTCTIPDKTSKEIANIEVRKLLPMFEKNCENLKEKETIHTSPNHIIQQIVKHVRFQNLKNEEYQDFENEVIKKISDIVFKKIGVENIEFQEMCNLHKSRLSNKTFDFSSYILEEQKNQIAYGHIVEETVQHKK